MSAIDREMENLYVNSIIILKSICFYIPRKHLRDVKTWERISGPSSTYFFHNKIFGFVVGCFCNVLVLLYVVISTTVPFYARNGT